MDWKNVLFIFGVSCIAAFILYRAVKKKKWCPNIYGSGSCFIENAGKNNKTRESTTFPDA